MNRTPLDDTLNALALTEDDKQLAIDLTGCVSIVEEDFAGEGSFGKVYRGTWTKHPPSRDKNDPLPEIAVKVFQGLYVRDEEKRRKIFKNLRRELSVWKRLTHDNILPLIGLACLDGTSHHPSLISLWMSNGSVLNYLESNPDANKLSIVRSMALGVQYLHNHEPSIVHGDLKPDNVLVDKDGNIRLCDFGLSRVQEQKTLWMTTATHAGGTIRYTAPEILMGSEATVTKDADIYAFAISSHHIMTGLLPFSSYRLDIQVLNAVCTRGVRPERIDPFELESYDSLWAILTDSWENDPTDRPHMDSVVTRLSSANFDINGTGYLLATASEDHVIRIWDAFSYDTVSMLTGHSNSVTWVAFSPDGQLLASSSIDTTVRIWNVSLGKLDRVFSIHSDSVWCVAFSPGGESVASASQDGYIKISKVSTGAVKSINNGAPVYRICFSRDGSILATGGSAGHVRFWNTIDGHFMHTAPGLQHRGEILSLSLSTNDMIVSSADDQTVFISQIHRIPNEQSIWLSDVLQEEHSRFVHSVTFSPDGQQIASASTDGGIAIRTLDGTIIKSLRGHVNLVYSLTYSSDGRYIASVSKDGTVRVWDPNSSEALVLLSEQKGSPIYCVAFSPPRNRTTI